MKKVQIIEMESFSCKGKLGYSLKTVHNGYASFNDICFSPDSKKIAYINQSCVELWSIDNYKKIGTFEDFETCFAVQFSSDGKYIALGQFGKIIIGKLDFNNSIPTLREVQEINDDEAVHNIWSIKFIMNDAYIVVGDEYGKAVIVSIANTEKEVCRLQMIAEILNISVSYNGEIMNLVISGSTGFYIWNVKKKEHLWIKTARKMINEMKYIPEFNLMIVTGASNQILIWDIELKKWIGSFEIENELVPVRVIYSRKTKKLAFATFEGVVFIWKLEDFSCEKLYTGMLISGINFDESGRYMVVASKTSKDLKIYDMETGDIRVINSPDVWSYDATFFPDEKNILVIGTRQCTQIDVENQSQNKRVYGYSYPYVETNLFDRLESRYVKKCLEEDFDMYLEQRFRRIGHITSNLYCGDREQLYLGTLQGYIEVLEANSNRCLALLRCEKNGSILYQLVRTDNYLQEFAREIQIK